MGTGTAVVDTVVTDDICERPPSTDDGVRDVDGKAEGSVGETGGVSVGVKGRERMVPGRDADGSKMLPPGETVGWLNDGVDNSDRGSTVGNDCCGGRLGSGSGLGKAGPGPP